GREEQQWREGRGGPPLRRGARPRRRHGRQCRSGVEHGPTARVSRSLAGAYTTRTEPPGDAMLTRLARRIADRSMIVMCAAALCAAGCKKADKPGGGGSGSSAGSRGSSGDTGGGGDKNAVRVVSDSSVRL